MWQPSWGSLAGGGSWRPGELTVASSAGAPGPSDKGPSEPLQAESGACPWQLSPLEGGWVAHCLIPMEDGP